MVEVTSLTEPLVDDAHPVHALMVADPVVLAQSVELDVEAVQWHVAVLVHTPLRPLLRQRRQLRVPFLQSFHTSHRQPLNAQSCQNGNVE